MHQEPTLIKARELFDHLIHNLFETAQREASLYDVEKLIWRSLLELGRLLLQFFIQSQGTGDLGPVLDYKGRTLNRLKTLYFRRYVTIFGEIQIPRTVYGTRENQKHEVVPLDARLGLPDSDFSSMLQDWAQGFCVHGSYQEASKILLKILGFTPSVRSLEHMACQMADTVDSFWETLEAPPAPEEGNIVVITADGKGVPMWKEADAGKEKEGHRRGKGEKAGSKKQACVGVFYTIDAFPRTAEDVVQECLRHQAREDRPSPCHKRVRAELSHQVDGQEVNGKDAIFAWFQDECKQRNADGSKPVVCLMDGDLALWKKLQEYMPGIIGILDLFHVLERLWTASYCFHREGSQAAQDFVTERLRSILNGQVGRVLGGLKQMATKHELRGTKLKQLQAIITYLDNHREWMRYDYYLALGYPIGSGVVEGACRHFVKDRMELSGMRWKPKGAQAILDLRATYINDDWQTFQRYRIKTNEQKLYPYRQQINDQWPQAA